jgi:AcrR family transcriptional regulator
MPRKEPSQRRSRDTTNAILDAAARVLIEHGYLRATTNRIAERAGCSIGTLYQYFGDKNEIFEALVHREADLYLNAVKSHLPASGATPEQAIRGFMEAGYANHSLIHTLRVVMRHLPSKNATARSQYLRTGIHTLMIKLLEALGPIPGEPDLSLTADIIIGLSEGLTYLGRVKRSPEELTNIMTDFVLGYVKPDATMGTLDSSQSSIHPSS